MTKTKIAAVLVAGVLPVYTANAAVTALTWDPTNVPAAPAGGTGTWDLSTANWSNGTSDALWTDTNGTTQSATFGGTAGTVTLGSNLGAAGLTFSVPNYTLDLSGKALTVSASGTNGINATATSGTTTIGTAGGTGGITVTGTPTFTAAAGGTLLFDAAITGTNIGVNIAGPGNVIFSGGATFGNTTNVASGTLTINGGTVQETNSALFANSSTLNISTGGTVSISSGSTFRGNTNGAVTNLNGGTLSIASGGIYSVSHAAAKVTLNLQSGEMDLANQLTQDAVTTGQVINFFGATVKLNASLTDLVSNTGNSRIADFAFNDVGGGNGVVIDTNGFNLGVSEAIAHTGTGADGGLTKKGLGILTLTTSNTYTGPTSVQSGLLIAKSTLGTPLGTSAVAVSSGASLWIQDHAGGGLPNITNALTLNGVWNGGNGALNLYNSANYSMTGTVNLATDAGIRLDPVTQSLPVNFTNAISGAGGLTLFTQGSSTGSSVLTLSGASTYLGNTVFTSSSNGTATTPAPFTINLTGGNNRLPSATTLTLGGTPAGGAGTFNKSVTVALNGISQQVAGLTVGSGAAGGTYSVVGASATPSTLVLNNAGADTFSGVLGGSGTNNNNLGLSMIGAGTFTLTGANTYTGPTLVQGGTLALGATATISGSTSIDVQAGAALDVSAQSNFATQSGQTLLGSGTVNGGVTVNGTLSPGDAGAGTLAVTGTTGLAGTAQLAYDLNTPDVAGGTGGNDLLTTSGLTLAQGVTLNVTLGAGFNPGTYHLIDYTGTLTDSSAGFTGWTVAGLPAADAYTFALGTDGSMPSVDLIVSGASAVPEPASLGLLAVGALGLLRRRRSA